MADDPPQDPPAAADPEPGPVRAALLAAVAGLVGVGVGVLVTLLVLSGGDAPDGPVPATPVVRSAGDPAAVTAVARAVLPSVVRVDVSTIGDGATVPGGNGSGAVVSDDGHIITNLHVVAGATAIQVHTDDGDVLDARLVGEDPAHDLALVQVDRTDLPPVAMGEAEDIEVGQLAIALGAPFGLSGSVTTGVVSAVGRPVEIVGVDGERMVLPSVIQTDAAINPGSSGGPLVDGEGRLIGVTSAILTAGGPAGAGVAFAVPVDEVVRAVDRMTSEGPEVDPIARGGPARIGLAGRTIPTAQAEVEGVDGGVIVDRVDPGGPAARAGLRPGDVLTRADGAPLAGINDLIRRVRDAGVGGSIVLRVVRDGTGLTATVMPAPGTG